MRSPESYAAAAVHGRDQCRQVPPCMRCEHTAEAVSVAVEEALKQAADECAAVRREHKKSGSYPMDMGGLALECEERIRQLVRGEP